MVILSAAVTTKNGRALLSRQFVDMNRLRVEGLLAAFPKLQGTREQTTYVRLIDRQRRYGHPTTSTSPSTVKYFPTAHHEQGVEHRRGPGNFEATQQGRPRNRRRGPEDKVSDHAFELVFAFDEVITTGGYRETLEHEDHRRQNFDMDSHEGQKLANMVKKSKLDAAKDQAKHMSQVIKQRQRDAMKTGWAAAARWPGWAVAIWTTTMSITVGVPSAARTTAILISWTSTRTRRHLPPNRNRLFKSRA